MPSKSSKSKKRKKRDCHSDTHFKKDGCKIHAKFTSCRDDNTLCLNLAGLTENLNFQLVRFKDCVVEIDTIFGVAENKVRGKICNVGIDFLEIKKENGTIVTILKDKVSQIRWLDEKCRTDVEVDQATAIGKK
ncbi:hypothetical protein [Peribacillus simplex]|uniref:hypothetical protein n=1 Tax=Peribacillus simplex TaxID=1478 RepID=UPI0011A7E99E|nr:hypothetical protein [Peribacillus simplex]